MAGIVSTAWLEKHAQERGMRVIDARGSFATYEEALLPTA
jgi:hypothetical protein